MATPPPPQAQHSPQGQGNPGMAIGGFVVGLIGLLLFWVPFLGVILALIGLVLSVLGMRQANERGAPKGLAIAGLACSILGVLAGGIWTVVVGLAVDEASNELDDLNEEFETLDTTAVIGLLMLRERILTPLRRING